MRVESFERVVCVIAPTAIHSRLMSLMLAVVKARDAAAGLRGVRKSDDAPTGNVTVADLATGGALPPATVATDVRRRRFRLPPESDVYAAVERAFSRYLKADVAPESLVIVHGLTIVIDRPAGFVQTGVGADGQPWTRTYTTPYGYLPGTAGGDGDELDVFVSSDTASQDAWWFTILTDAGAFDEYKVVLCAASEDAARAVIAAHIPARFVAPGCAMTSISMIKALLGQDQREGEEAVEQIAKSIERAAAHERVKKASLGAMNYTNESTPIADHPELAEHPALTAKLTGCYGIPANMGGILGWIEDEEMTWIAFVWIDGKALLWTQREADGGVLGAPVSFTRPDIVAGDIVVSPNKATSDGFAAMPDGASTPIEKHVRTLKSSVAEELRYILGIVLEPEVVDGQKEIYSAEEIRKSAWMWLRDFRNIDLEHKLYVNDLVEVVESYVTTCDMQIGGQPVLAGTWLLGTVVKDDGMWADIKSGKLTGYSINGFSKKKPA